MVEGFLVRMRRDRLYELTGVQILPINTLFQLHAMVMRKAPELKLADHIAFMPDIFNYYLCDFWRTEFTMTTTSQLFNPRTGLWEQEIIDELGGLDLFWLPIAPTGWELPRLTPELSRKTGLMSPKVRTVASHDTASAVAAVPASDEDFAYISSGSWSLVGFEAGAPIITDRSRELNFTNEGGVMGTFCILKNVTGLWLLQECRRTWKEVRSANDEVRTRNVRTSDFGLRTSYDELVHLAEQAEPFRSLIDPDAREFAYPQDMPRQIAEYCRRTGQPIPDNPGRVARCILESLALAYRSVIAEIPEIRGRPVKTIHIVGGGAQNRLLNRMTADATGLPVLAGPVEATTIGNVLVQAWANHELASLKEMRALVRRSFELGHYEPQATERWAEPYERWRKLAKPKR
jgi:rhamnulokinase